MQDLRTLDAEVSRSKGANVVQVLDKHLKIGAADDSSKVRQDMPKFSGFAVGRFQRVNGCKKIWPPSLNIMDRKLSPKGWTVKSPKPLKHMGFQLVCVFTLPGPDRESERERKRKKERERERERE